MAKAVFFSIPAHGHINPTLAIAAGLVTGGEKVLYYTTQAFEEKVCATGAEARVVATRFDDYVETQGMTRGRNAFAVASCLLEASLEILDKIVAGVRSEQPDYIVHDAITIYGKLVARLLDLPAVATIPSPCWGAGHLDDVPLWFALKIAAQALVAPHELLRCFLLSRRMKKTYGSGFFGPLSVFRCYEELNIITTSRIFQPNAAKLDPARFSICGPMLTASDDGRSIPQRSKGRKLIYISLGTVYNRDIAFYRECFKAFSDSRYDVLVSTGGADVRAGQAGTPSNFRFAPYVPQMQVLRRAAAFISHGGMNSLNEALFQAVPLVLVPKALDQYINSRIVAGLGAGIYVRKPSARNLRKAVDRVVTDPGFRSVARRWSAVIRSEGGVEAALRALERFKREHGIV